jgi:hypothetical protein
MSIQKLLSETSFDQMLLPSDTSFEISEKTQKSLITYLPVLYQPCTMTVRGQHGSGPALPAGRQAVGRHYETITQIRKPNKRKI